MTSTTRDGNVSATTDPSGAVDPWTCEGRVSPTAAELLERLASADTSIIVTMCVTPILFGVMSVLFLDVMIFIIKQPMHWRRKTYYAWALSCYPVLGMLNVMGQFMPASAGVISFASSFYFAICVKKFCQQVIDLFGSKTKMAAVLEGDGVFPPNPFPCCFVFCCCRNQAMTVHRINIIQGVIYQVIFFHPTIYFVQNILVAEGFNRVPIGVAVINLLGYLGTGSSLVAIYGFVILAKSSRVALGQYFLRAKYLCIQLVVACNTAQGFTLSVLQSYDQVPCGFPYPDPKRAFILHTWILQIELFLLSLAAWWFYRRSEVDCRVVIPQNDIALTETTIENLTNEKCEVTCDKVDVISEKSSSSPSSSEDSGVSSPRTDHKWNMDSMGPDSKETMDSKGPDQERNVYLPGTDFSRESQVCLSQFF